MRNIIIAILATVISAQAQPTLANSDDIAAAKARANHTGTQAISTVTGLQTALDGKAALPTAIPVFTKARIPFSVGGNSSGITATGSRRRMVAIHNADNIRVVFQNCFGETDGLSPVTVKAAIEDSLGNTTPILFSGSRTAVVAVNGSFTISDIVSGLTVIAGREYFIRTRYSWTSGNMQLPFVFDSTSSPGEGKADTVDIVDNTGSTGFSGGAGYTIGSSMVLGTPTDRKNHPVIGFLGDSILNELPGAVTIGGYLPYNDNWSVSALGYESGRNFSYIRLSINGATASGANNPASTKVRLYYPYLTHVICNFGLNDVRGSDSAATIQANIQSIWRELKTVGVKRIWQTTITPDTSTPGTPGSDEAMRITMNTFYRTVPNPLFGIIEAADAMETSRNSGVWKTNYNNPDLYHPSNLAGADLRALVPTELFD